MERSRLASAALCLVAALVAAGCTAPGATQDLDAHSAATGRIHVFEGAYDTTGDRARVLVEGAYEPLPAEAIEIESPLDGAAIQIAFVRPDVPPDVKVPIIVDVSPYLPALTPEVLESSAFYESFGADFVPHGYAFALVAVRGTAASGGCFDYLGVKERTDADAAITWLGEQEWSNGNVGMIGISYDGSTPWEVAAMGNPHLKTITPIAGISDYFQLNYRNGSVNSFGLMLEFAFYWAVPLASEAGFVAPDRWAQHAACPGGPEVGAAQAYSSAAGERDPMGFWEERNLRPDVLASYEGSVFLVHGLFDTNVAPSQGYPLVERLAEKGVRVKHMLGQWGHAIPGSPSIVNENVRWDWSEVLLRWFDHELKGNASVDTGPVAQVQDTAGLWRSEDAWPPADATPTTLFLTAAGGLASEPDAATASFPIAPPVWVPDPGQPRNSPGDLWRASLFEACPACATFATEPMEEDLRFAGLPQAHITVTPTAAFGHVTVHLFEESEEGSTRLAWGSIDLRFADGTEVAKPVVPGQPLLVKLEMEPTDAVVRAGSRLVLVAHQGGYSDYLPRVPTAPVVVEAGGEASALMLRVFERTAGDPAYFFEPPS